MKRLISSGSAFSILCHAGVALAALLSPAFAYEPIAELPSIDVEFVASLEPPHGALQVAKLEQVSSTQQTAENAPEKEQKLEVKQLVEEVKAPEAEHELQKSVEIALPIEPTDKPSKTQDILAVIPPLKNQPKLKAKTAELIEDKPDLKDIRKERLRKQLEHKKRAEKSKKAPQQQILEQQIRQARKAPPKNFASERADRVGTQEARAETGMSQVSYGALISAQINARKFYPASARTEEATGAVGVAFTIGSSGRTKSANVIRSSGNTALDSAARQAVLSVSAPPPPQGLFNGSINVRFNLN